MPKPNEVPDKEGNSPGKETAAGGAGFSLESIEDPEIKEFAQRKFGSSIEGMSPDEIVLQSLKMQHNQEKMHSLQANELGVLRKKIDQVVSGRISPEPKGQNQPGSTEEGGLPVKYLEEFNSKMTKLDELSNQLSKLPSTTKEIEAMKTQMESMLGTMKNSMNRMSESESLAAIRDRKIVADLIEEDFDTLKKQYAKDKDGERKAIALMEKILPYLDKDPTKNPMGEKTKSFIDVVWSREHPVLTVRNMFFPEEVANKPPPSEGGSKSSIPGEESSEPAEKQYLEHLADLTNKKYT